MCAEIEKYIKKEIERETEHPPPNKTEFGFCLKKIATQRKQQTHSHSVVTYTHDE